MTWNRKIRPEQTEGLVPYTGATQDVDLGENGISTGFVKFDTTPTDIPEEQGVMFWDEDDNTVDVILNGYRMKIGEDQFYPVKNQSGSTILKGTNVKFAGTVGASGRLLILPFLADGTAPSYVYMGVTAEDIADGEDGKVLWFGRLRGLNTNAFNEGDVLYASTTSAGGFQNTIPTGTNNVVQVSAVIKKSVNQGVIFIRPQIEPFAKIPTLQDVTDEGAVTTNPIEVGTRIIVNDAGGDGDEVMKFNYDTDQGEPRFVFENQDGGKFELTFASPASGTKTLIYSEESGVSPVDKTVNANFTAFNFASYTAIATLTVTDPTPVEGQGYIVFVRNGTTTIGGVGYTSGNLIYRFYQGGAWSSTVFVNQTQLAEKENIATATTGSEILFVTPQIYNSPASPSTANITNDLTGARIGVIQKIYHNHSVAPTVPGGWVLIGGTYTVSVLNIIYAEWVSGSRVEYWVVN
jgi:hypothetical protein